VHAPPDRDREIRRIVTAKSAASWPPNPPHRDREIRRIVTAKSTASW